MAEAEEDKTDICIITDGSSCGDNEPITDGLVGPSVMWPDGLVRDVSLM